MFNYAPNDKSGPSGISENHLRKVPVETKPSAKRKSLVPGNKTRKTAGKEESLVPLAQKLLSQLAKEKEISQGIFYVVTGTGNKKKLKYVTGYAYEKIETEDIVFEFGEGFPGQVAMDAKLMTISEVPDGYLTIISGLGSAKPASLLLFPVIYKNNVIAVIELASFHRFNVNDESYFTEFAMKASGEIISIIKHK